eukprot:TRINITY_DN67264_c8_g1_i1.p1 TRINITY_DN67264_c8_g1~~TRINITY_DN67264_c8_g1_i1.p1  ORF type:complete len:308 (+),score=34.05 TRINITY_DN67264_c8_g1_i1:172-1095(+)
MTSVQPTYLVIDSLNRAGIVQVNRKNLYHTLGKAKYVEGQPSQLCKRFHQGNCSLGIKCPHMHINPKYIREKRTASENCLKCCLSHDGGITAETRRVIVSKTSPDGVEFQCDFPIAQFSPTKVLDNAPPGGTHINMLADKVCRLHLLGKCSFGLKCAHLHLCRDTYQRFFGEMEDKDVAVTDSFSTVSDADGSLQGTQHVDLSLSSSSVGSSLLTMIGDEPLLTITPPTTTTGSLPSEHSSLSSLESVGTSTFSCEDEPVDEEELFPWLPSRSELRVQSAAVSHNDVGQARKMSGSKYLPVEDSGLH